MKPNKKNLYHYNRFLENQNNKSPASGIIGELIKRLLDRKKLTLQNPIEH